MKNGNGRRRIVVRGMVAVAGMLVLAALTFPSPAAANAPDTPCNEKCHADYIEDAVKCGKIMENQEAYYACHNKAYERHKSCRQSCTQKENDCLEACKDLCYQIMDRCKGDCATHPNPRECRG